MRMERLQTVLASKETRDVSFDPAIHEAQREEMREESDKEVES